MSILTSIARQMKASRYTVALTGAGLSAESGIPTYRGKGGLWTKYDPKRYAHIHSFLQDPSYYWNFFRQLRYPMLKKAQPNRAHRAMAEMERAKKLHRIITQNIDGLHQEAGSASVIELHGTSRTISCMSCSARYSMDDAFRMLETRCPPRCPECGGKLRPSVIFFGEPLKPEVLESAFREAEKSDVFLVVGSSLVVHPAADLPLRALEGGARLVIINREETPLDEAADFLVHDEAGKILPDLARRIINAG
ncbi:MAG: NAD-dependent deacetylase [Candidatus Aminicenantales bacterium]